MPPGQPDELSRPQAAVLASLLAGESVPAAAKAAGLDPRAVQGWLSDDHTFRAAYNRGRRELADAAQTRLLSLAERATRTLEAALDTGDTRAAVALLKGLGMLSGQAPAIGSGDVGQLRTEAEMGAAHRREMDELNALLAGL